ncbi:hypothetical protein EIK56_18200 [Sphingomonas sp. C8-2]|nr:hypothetical protein EIK56_18200 [Sphingomonas sp. C8-2]
MADGVIMRPVETMPPDRRDGRVVLIHTHSAVYRARFFSGSDAWCEVVTGGQILGVIGWADANNLDRRT